MIWLSSITTLQANYTDTAGHKYAFFSVASDNVGNREAAPLSSDATTSVSHHRWQNPTNRFDVDDDGSVAPIDVLQINNNLRRFGTRALPETPTAIQLPPPFIDVDGYDSVAPIDVLQVINFLRRRTTSVGGESNLVVALTQLADEQATETIMSSNA